MGLFKDVYCDECGKKAGMLMRVKLQDGKCLCASCSEAVPTHAYTSLLKSYTLDMYHDFKDYIRYSNEYLRPLFKETHKYFILHVDVENKIFYIGRNIDERTVFYHFRNVADFDLIFDAKEFKEGIIGDKVTGKILMELEMNNPPFRYEEILDRSATAKAEKTLFGSKVRYGSPKGMEEFLQVFLALWKESILEQYEDDSVYEEDYTTEYETHTPTAASELQQAMALFMIDDLNTLTLKELKLQRNKLIKTFHPDTSDANNTKYAQKINTAYEVLKRALGE